MVRNAIREARLKEIKQELLVSDKLKVSHLCVSLGSSRCADGLQWLPRFCCA